MITKTLSDNLNMLMAKSRLNSSELARLTGLPATTIKRIRNNEQSNPTLATLLPIAKHFAISINELLDGEVVSKLESFSVNKNSHYIPLLSWQQCDFNRFSATAKKIGTELLLSNQAFALQVEEHDLVVFPAKSILIIDPAVTPVSGDYVIVTKAQQEVASIKKYIVDTDDVYLKSLVPGLGITQLTEEYQIRGVVVQYKVELKTR